MTTTTDTTTHRAGPAWNGPANAIGHWYCRPSDCEIVRVAYTLDHIDNIEAQVEAAKKIIRAREARAARLFDVEKGTT